MNYRRTLSTINLHCLPVLLSPRTREEESSVPFSSKRRTKKKQLYPKDWERRRRVQELLYKNHMTVSQLADELGIKSTGNLGAIIWGRRRIRKWELAIAEYFGVSWEELFSPNHSQEGAA